MGFFGYVCSGKVEAKYSEPGAFESYVDKASYKYEGNPSPAEPFTDKNQWKYKRIVDESVVVVTAVSSKVREEALEIWGSLHRRSFNWGLVTVLAAGSVGILAAFKVLSAPFIIVAIALALISIRMFYLCSQASDKCAKWKDPIDNIIQARQQCSDPAKGGFAALRRDQQKRLAFHPDEVKHIWWNTVVSQNEDFNNAYSSDVPSKKAFVKRFITKENPFSKESIKDIFNGGEVYNPFKCESKNIDKINLIVNKFSKCMGNRSEIEKEFRLKFQEINKNKQKLLEENEKKTDFLLKPHRIKYEKAKLFLEKKYNEECAPFLEKYNEQTKQNVTRITELRKNENKEESLKNVVISKDNGLLLEEKSIEESMSKSTKEFNDKTYYFKRNYELSLKEFEHYFDCEIKPIFEHRKKQEDEIIEDADQKWERLKSQRSWELVSMMSDIKEMYDIFNETEPSLESIPSDSLYQFNFVLKDYPQGDFTIQNPPPYNPNYQPEEKFEYESIGYQGYLKMAEQAK